MGLLSLTPRRVLVLRRCSVTAGLVLIASGALLSTLLIVPATALADYNRDHCRIKPKTNPQDCITEPADYASRFENRRVQCVDPRLFGVQVNNGTLDDGREGRLYQKEFDLAWTVSHQNLENWLEFRCRFDNDLDVFVAIAGNVGFIGAPLGPNAQGGGFLAEYVVYNGNAFEGPSPVSFEVPTIAFWSQLLEDEYDFIVPLDVQKSLIRDYSNLRFRRSEEYEDQYDYWSVYSKITGCKPAKWDTSMAFATVLQPTGDNPLNKNCSKPTRRALKKIESKVPDQTTKQCLENFREHFPHRASTKKQAAWVRIALDLCFDVNSNNTTVGLGWAPSPNAQLGRRKWKRQTVAEKQTGREFVIPNRKLKGWYPHRTSGPNSNWTSFSVDVPKETVDYTHGFPSR